MSIAPPGHPLPPPDLPELPAGVSPSDVMTRATWTPMLAAFGGLGIFIGAGIFGGVALLIGLPFGVKADDLPPSINFLSILLQDGAIVVGVWLVVRASGSSAIAESLGIRPTRFWPAVGWAALLFVALNLFSAFWDQIVNAPSEKLLQDVGADQTVLAAVAICFAVCVIAPLAEETLFRGFIFGGLRRWQGFWPAAIISGSMFGAAHALGSPVQFLLPLALFGFLLALLYELTKSIIPGIYLHSVNNCLAFSVGLHLGWEIPLVFVGSLSAITLALTATRRMA